MNVAQYILAYDVRYNNYRVTNDPQFKTLYIRRRSQLLRENVKKEYDPSIRKQYFTQRKLILAKKYGPLPVTSSTRSTLTLRSRGSSVATSFDNLQADGFRGGGSVVQHYPADTSRNLTGGGVGGGVPNNKKMLAMTDTIPDELLENEGVVPTKIASASRAMAGNTTLSENYAFSGMFHIFDQHTDAVTCVKFAQNDRYLLACSSKDSTISVCSLDTSPPSVKFILMGHTAVVNDLDWSLTNDLLVSASSDCTSHIWTPSCGKKVRELHDNFNSPVNACRFMPLNNNLVVTGNQKGYIQVFNVSTGKCAKDGVVRANAAIKCMEFNPAGTLLWTGDEKGVLMSFMFNIITGKLSRGSKVLLCVNKCITSISARTWVSREARDPSLLISLANDALRLYGVSNTNAHVQLKAVFPVKYGKNHIRSSFCPLTSFRQGACIVTGSEDMSVYLYNIDDTQKPLNTLLGHSSPVTDVCWNYDESLLASCDLEGTVIIWKREQHGIRS